MGGLVLGILVWQEGGDLVAELMLLGAASLAGLVLPSLTCHRARVAPRAIRSSRRRVRA